MGERGFPRPQMGVGLGVECLAGEAHGRYTWARQVPVFEKPPSEEGGPTSSPSDVSVQEEDGVDKQGTVPRAHMLGCSTLFCREQGRTGPHS